MGRTTRLRAAMLGTLVAAIGLAGCGEFVPINGDEDNASAEAVTTEVASAASDDGWPEGTIELDWRESLRGYTDEGVGEGDRLTFWCPPAGDQNVDTRVFGTDVYWTNSPGCSTAVHAGVITFDEGGWFVVEVLEDVAHHEVEVAPRNDIEPRQWSRRATGFRVLDAS